MAGLFDNELARFLITPRAYFAQQDQAKQVEQFKGLLGGLQQQGPTQPGGVLQSKAPDQQFWLQAATIPAFQQLASQQLGYEAQGGQALARQQQAQQWESQNLTEAQRQQLGLNQLKAERDYAIDQQDLQRKWYGTEASAASSYASAASSDASRQLSGARLEQQLRENQRQAGGLLDRLPPTDQLKARQDLLTKDTWAQAAGDVADWASNRGKGAAIPLVGTAEADAFNTEWQTSVRPAFMQIMNTGVLQEGEREALEAIMGQPADKILTESQVNVIKTVAQKVNDLRADSYRALGLQPPALKKGSSAAARTLSGGQPQGQVRPVSALPSPGAGAGRPEPGGTIWQPVQRY